MYQPAKSGARIVFIDGKNQSIGEGIIEFYTDAQLAEIFVKVLEIFVKN